MKNLFKARWMTSLIFLILLFVITGIAAPGFLTYDNIVTCFNTATMYTLLAVGIAFVIMTGEIDVSIGATLGLTAGMTGLIAQQGGSIPKMLLLCLVTGAAIGLVNGVGVSYFGVPSLIFTLGTNSVVRGLIYIMSGGRTIENFGGAISSYGNKTVFAGITLYYAIAVVLVAISHLALTKTRKGKYFIAVGDNAGGANLVGISVLSTKILAYVLCGLFAGLGGFVFASKYGQVMTVAGNGYEMTAIAACVLGGISLSGGLGNVIGAAIGAVIMSLIDSGSSGLLAGMGITGVPAYIIAIAVGILLGVLLGECTGVLVAHFGMPPFIATLGMMKICRSVTQQCMQKASPTVPKAFLKIANARIGGEIILPILYWLALAAILHVVSKHTAFGRQVFAIGSNERTSKLSGVNVRAVKRRVYALMGALVAITAVIQIARIGSMDYANAGSGYEMDAIAAVIIGGTSMSGGRGSVVGSVLGMLILAVMNNLLNLIGVPPFLREAFKGIIVIGAVLLQKKEKAS